MKSRERLCLVFIYVGLHTVLTSQRRIGDMVIVVVAVAQVLIGSRVDSLEAHPSQLEVAYRQVLLGVLKFLFEHRPLHTMSQVDSFHHVVGHTTSHHSQLHQQYTTGVGFSQLK